MHQLKNKWEEIVDDSDNKKITIKEIKLKKNESCQKSKAAYTLA
jgi:hypothetical protein